MKSATSSSAIQTKATYPTPSAHHGISGRWKPRRFPFCAVNPLACLELSKAVATSNRGASARHSPSGEPNVSSAPPTKSSAKANPKGSPQRNGGWSTGGCPAPCSVQVQVRIHRPDEGAGSHICRPVKNIWQAACSSLPPRNGTHICRPVKNSWQPPCFVW